MALMQPHPHLFPEGPRPLHPWGSLGLAQAWQLGRRARGEGKMCRGGGVLKPLLLASRNHGAPTSKQSSAPRVTGSFRPSRERPGGILRLPSFQVRAETPQRLLLLQSSGSSTRLHSLLPRTLAPASRALLSLIRPYDTPHWSEPLNLYLAEVKASNALESPLAAQI